MTSAILAIDQGTTNTKALLIDPAGTVVAKAARQTRTVYRRPGWVEQSPQDIWDSTLAAIDGCRSDFARHPIAGIGISNQRESVLLWERSSGRPLGPCISWQCRRTAERLATLRGTPEVGRVEARTGLALDPLFPAAKIAWLLDAEPGLRARAETGAICAGTVDSWLIFNLTGGRVHATDMGNAARTQLFDIHTCKWEADLAAFFDVPLAVLPAVLPSDAAFGETRDVAALPDGVPIRAAMGDSHAALFGHGIRAPGAVKATYGTGTSLMALTEGPRASRHGLSSTIAWARGGRPAHALEGNISVSGQGAAFVSGLLGLKDAAALTALAGEVDASEGVVFVPALVGLGAPYWREDVRGQISGLSPGTTPAHIARAALEAIALQVCDVFTALETDLGTTLTEIRADGGGSASRVLMQIQADLLDRPVLGNPLAELSAAGVAAMAGIGAAFWDEETARGLFAAGARESVPAMAKRTRAAVLETWRAAVAGLLGTGRESTVRERPDEAKRADAMLRDRSAGGEGGRAAGWR